MSESDSLSLARGLGLEPVSNPPPEQYVTGMGAPACHQSHQTAPVRLLLADGQELQVSAIVIAAFCLVAALLGFQAPPFLTSRM